MPTLSEFLKKRHQFKERLKIGAIVKLYSYFNIPDNKIKFVGKVATVNSDDEILDMVSVSVNEESVLWPIDAVKIKSEARNFKYAESLINVSSPNKDELLFVAKRNNQIIGAIGVNPKEATKGFKLIRSLVRNNNREEKYFVRWKTIPVNSNLHKFLKKLASNHELDIKFDFGLKNTTVYVHRDNLNKLNALAAQISE